MAIDIRRLIREEIGSAKAPDPHVIAKRVITHISKTDCPEVLEILLVPEVRTVARVLRTGNRKPQKSERWQGAVEAHDLFRQWENLGDQYKYLGECTVADLKLVIDLYEARADQNLAQAEARENLISEMKKKKAKVVSDLPEDTVRTILGA